MRDIMLSIYRRFRSVSWSHIGHTTEHEYAQNKDRHTNRAYWLCLQPSLFILTIKRVYKFHFLKLPIFFAVIRFARCMSRYHWK